MSAFLDAFAKETKLEPQEASEQWAAYSRQLNDAQIRKIERGGTKQGVRMGKAFVRHFGTEIGENE